MSMIVRYGRSDTANVHTYRFREKTRYKPAGKLGMLCGPICFHNIGLNSVLQLTSSQMNHFISNNFLSIFAS